MIRTLIIFLLICATTFAAEINLPKRRAAAPSGTEFANQIRDLPLADREIRIKQEILSGNVPNFWRTFQPVLIENAKLHVAPDYLCVGSDEDFFLAPLTPETAQAIADSSDCILPTPKIVDEIYRTAHVKLTPRPIPPSAAMTTVPIFIQHNQIVSTQRHAHPTNLIAGHKKDVVITSRLTNAPGKVAIYGWHQTNGTPIQPLYLGHTSQWVDYSHGARLVLREMTVDGQPTTVDAVLANPNVCALLSNEGPIQAARYGPDSFTENNFEFNIEPGVRVLINSPAPLNTNKPTRLIYYALPNGNTIEQTVGRKLKPGDDWHFDIQHIGAQTRWLRRRSNDANLVIAYLECAEKSWPAWRRKNDVDNRRIPKILDEVRSQTAATSVKIVLTGHSGGGSFTFSYLNGIVAIPEEVERIAFLDSNYAYDSAQGHTDKLAHWLSASQNHYLCVLAYHDNIALLNGKTFVSENGGTWGRSHAMLADLGKRFEIASQIDDDWERHRGLDGRLQFLLKKNPAKEILHTIQVERNGFIHAMLSGTPAESQGYTYFGPRAYSDLIRND